jgi:hypothetical protein
MGLGHAGSRRNGMERAGEIETELKATDSETCDLINRRTRCGRKFDNSII